LKADCGHLGSTIIDEYRDPLMIVLKRTFKSPSDEHWKETCERVRLALIARYGSDLRAKSVPFSLGSGNFWWLIQKMQSCGILPADVDTTPRRRSSDSQ
jgi:hypothetical protein